MTRSTAYDRFPEHRIEIDAERVGVRVRVRLDGTLLAQTSRGLSLREGTYAPVVYVPREDVRMDRLARSDHSTHCPFKGDASYFDFAAGEASVEQVAWSYEDPFDQMIAIRDHLAFYPDRVEIEPVDS